MNRTFYIFMDEKMAISTDYSSSFQYYYSPLTNSTADEEVSPHADVSSIPDKSTKNQEVKGDELSDEEKKEVSELKKRDLEVRSHEQAHIAAGGAYVRGGASFSYQTGPDGKKYAVGGEVSIDTSSVSGDPEATIRKMQVVRKAALAPASPSSTDRSVAAAASQKMNAARMEQAKQQTEEGEKTDKSKDSIEKTKNYDEKGASEKSAVDIGSVVDLSA